MASPSNARLLGHPANPSQETMSSWGMTPLDRYPDARYQVKLQQALSGVHGDTALAQGEEDGPDSNHSSSATTLEEGPGGRGSDPYKMAQDSQGVVKSPEAPPAPIQAQPMFTSAKRVDAIAKLKRAASQREMKGREAAAETSTASRVNTPIEEVLQVTMPMHNANAQEEYRGERLNHALARDNVDSPSSFLTAVGGPEYSKKAVSPIPPLFNRLEQLRSESPARSIRDGAGTPLGGESLLNRSRSQRGDTKSPLPSLEQLRARILQERATAGLARSASTSAASAAARAYALEKLLGDSTREGAVSPASDTAEDQEEEKKVKEVGRGGLSVPDDVRRPMLRRSRTIGGLSAAAEAQRKAEFVKALDEGVPDSERSIKRSSRRFAKAPPGGRTSTSSKPSDPPIAEEPFKADDRSGMANITKSEAESGKGADLDRSQSQRQVARAEMLRKLSGRGRLGQRSPLPAVAPSLEMHGVDTVDAERERVKDTLTVNDFSSASPQSARLALPVSPSAMSSNGLAPPLSPGFSLLTVPGAGQVAHSSSSRASTVLTSQHEFDRNRASEMAMLMGEEAFEYEKLLEMGYSTDDAYERVASARSGSFADMSYNASPLSHQGEFAPRDSPPLSSQAGPFHQAAYAEWGTPEESTSHAASLPTAAQPRLEEGWMPKRPSVASIPLGLDARRGSSENGMDDDGNDAQEEIDTSHGFGKPLYNRRVAWPESVTSATVSDFSSPKRSDSLKRGSDASTTNAKWRPALALSPSNGSNLERIEDVLTPGFLHDIGNPLDYSSSPHSPEVRSTFAAQEREGQSGGAVLPKEDSDEYLREVDRMALELKNFTRRDNAHVNSTSRRARDAAVQQSSAAQAAAAASDVARREWKESAPSSLPNEAAASSMALPPTRAAGAPPVSSMGQDAFSSRALSTGHSTPLSSNAYSPASVNDRPLPSIPASLPSASMPPATESDPHAAIDKADATSASVTNEVMAKPSYRKPAPLEGIPSAALGKAVNVAEDEEGYEDRRWEEQRMADKKGDTTASKPSTFFSSLRRKASNAAARVNGGGGSANGNDSSSPSKKFGSLLRRKPSDAKALTRNTSPAVDSVGGDGGGGGEAAAAAMGVPSTSSETSLHSTSTLRGPTSAGEMARSAAPEQIPPSQSMSLGLAPATTAALHRYSRILTSPHEPARFPQIPGLSRQDMEDPPRKFLFATPVLQVVSSSSVKDRFLLVFSDLVVVAKPVAPSNSGKGDAHELPTLDWTFSVRDILDIAQLSRLTASNEERRRPGKSVALMEAFVQEFRWSPEQAIESIIAQSNLPRTYSTVAQLLHQTPELDRQQLSNYLFGSTDAARREVARAFVCLEKYAGVSIESALRSLLLEIRFPSTLDAFEDLLVTFAAKWTSSNRGLIKEAFSEQLAIDLVFAIMSLNDALHSNAETTPAMFNNAMPHFTREDFLLAFRPRDAIMVLSDRTLSRIYTSISQDAIQQAPLPNEAGPRYSARIQSPGVPLRLIYGVYSEPIRIAIPRCDADFAIRMYGQDVAFQPQILTFERSSTQEFRIMSKSLGVKSIVFIKSGRNARYYQTSFPAEGSRDFGLPRSINVTVERAFKQYCFSFTYPPSDRRYTFSVEGAAKRQQCLSVINERVTYLEESSARNPTAQAVALHVLREALQEPEEYSSRQAQLQRSASAVSPSNGSAYATSSALQRAPSDSRAFGGMGMAGSGVGGNGSRMPNTSINRQESTSKHYYHSQGVREKDLSPLEEDKKTEAALYAVRPLRGDELILTVRQNSLLSLVVAHTQRQI